MANDINKVILVCRLTRDMELAYMQSGTAVGKMSVAVGRTYKNGDQKVDKTSFFDVTLFGKPAEALKQYLVKGKQIVVTGSLKQDRWEKDGQKHSRVSIIADNIQLLGGSGSGNGNSKPSQSEEVPAYDGEDAFPEEIPF